MFVSDISTTMGWICGNDEDYAAAVRILEGLRDKGERMAVHAHWPGELSCLLLQAQQSGVSVSETERFSLYIQRLDIHVDWRQMARWLDVIPRLASTENLSVYQAATLDLALREGWPIRSIDSQLIDAAKKRGVLCQ